MSIKEKYSAAEQPSVLTDEWSAENVIDIAAERCLFEQTYVGRDFSKAFTFEGVGEYASPTTEALWRGFLKRASIAAVPHLACHSPAPEKAEPVAWLEAEPSARGQDPRNVAWSMLYSTCIHTKCAPMTSNPVWPLYAAPVAQEVEPGSAPAAAEEVRDGWISVDERLPEAKQIVLVKSENWEFPAVLKYQKLPFQRFLDEVNGRWYWYPERMHWMPLPAAPEVKTTASAATSADGGA